MSRVISWFSCGAASAVATKLAIADNPETIVAYCEVKEEHPDNKRFLKDCENWFGREIIVMGNDSYKRSIDEVFWQRKYMAGIAGAPCTLLLKKSIRGDFELPDDTQVFGYTCEEQGRIDRFIDANPDVVMVNPLMDRGLTKSDVLAMILDAGIELPEMYKLGYKNNNCCGCVKAGSPAYWKKIGIDFPKRFTRMAGMELITGANLCSLSMSVVKNKYPETYLMLGSPPTEIDGKQQTWRFRLTEIPEDLEAMDDTVDIQCGIFCEMAEHEYS